MASSDQRLSELKNKYNAVISLTQQLGGNLLNVHVENNKLLIRAQAPSQEVKNKIWDQIKQIDASYSDLTADITVQPGATTQQAQQTQQAPQAQAGGQTYTVQAGDTLSKLAQRFYGNAGDYMVIFNANRDKLTDPNMIRVGQELLIPQK
jgi:nucleoid-associated protein YgaU